MRNAFCCFVIPYLCVLIGTMLSHFGVLSPLASTVRQSLGFVSLPLLSALSHAGHIHTPTCDACCDDIRGMWSVCVQHDYHSTLEACQRVFVLAVNAPNQHFSTTKAT